MSGFLITLAVCVQVWLCYRFFKCCQVFIAKQKRPPAEPAIEYTIMDRVYMESIINGTMLCFSGPWMAMTSARIFGQVINFDDENIVIRRYVGNSSEKMPVEVIPKSHVISVGYAVGREADLHNKFYAVAKCFGKENATLGG